MVKTDPYLDKCRQMAEQSLNWGSSAGWTNEDFENLSDKIEEKTQVKLSVSTLKRIWGKVRYESSPTAATLNALAKFSGFENWRDFQQKNAVTEAQNTNGTLPEKIEVPGIEKLPHAASRKKVFVTITALIVLAVISLGLITLLKSKKNTASSPTGEVKFSSRKTSDDLPNSVVFDYDASAFHSDNVYIQQNWDTTRRQKVPGDGRQVTSIYYYPGYFNSKLIVDGEIKKLSPVFIKTKGWKGIIERKPVPIYLAPAEIEGKGVMAISANTLQQKINSPVFNDTWVDFTNVREFTNINAADFTFETTVRNTSTVEQSLCRKIKVTVLGTQSAIIIPLSDKGCIADIDLLTGYEWIIGKEHDLSAFGCDVRQFQHLKFTVNDHRLKIYLNDKMVMDVAQLGNIGAVIGIRYAFEGTGEVKDVKMFSLEKAGYEEKF